MVLKRLAEGANQGLSICELLDLSNEAEMYVTGLVCCNRSDLLLRVCRCIVSPSSIVGYVEMMHIYFGKKSLFSVYLHC